MQITRGTMSQSDITELKRQIEDSIKPAGMTVKVVAIDGHGGSGKSTLALKLSRALSAQIIHTDDFASWNKPHDWWKRIINEVLGPIRAQAKTLSYQRGSWGPDHHPEAVKNQPVTSIIILEGVSSARQEFREYLAYSIWVETPIELCLERGLERDGQAALPDWRKWIADENDYIARDNPQAYVDTIVSGTF